MKRSNPISSTRATGRQPVIEPAPFRILMNNGLPTSVCFSACSNNQVPEFEMGTSYTFYDTLPFMLCEEKVCKKKMQNNVEHIGKCGWIFVYIIFFQYET